MESDKRLMEPLLRFRVPLSLAITKGAKEDDVASVAPGEPTASWLRSPLGNNQLGLIHLIALIAAILCFLFAVQLFVRTGLKPATTKLDGAEKRNFRQRLDTSSFRSFWSSAVVSQSGESCSSSAATLGSACKQPNLGATPPSSTNRPKQVEQLLAKMVSLLSKQAPNSDESPLVAAQAEEALKGSKQACEVDQLTNESQNTDCQLTSTGSFRSSKSYIKSLMDVLAKARAQIHTPGDLLVHKSSLSGDEPESIARQAELLASCQVPNKDEDEEDDGCGVVMSQMDISAAHLILDYMEKHLEDKERLRREWSELNANSDRRAGAATKLNQAMLNRLAKSALTEQNRNKNTSLEVVPFDWNRVKLGSPAKGCTALGGVSCAGSASAASLGLHARQLKSMEIASDYINASFIYDDDPRRPTHIIAQGPNEQTVGQFWQMIWEQGVSVIVMLTRLNEDSKRMCHCYWPTSQNVAKSNADLTGPTGEPMEQEQTLLIGCDTIGSSTGSTGQLGNGRRGSVTSVFNKLSSRHSSSGQPIIANGDLNNNLLVFDLASPQFVASASSSSEPASKGPSASNSAKLNNKLELHLVSEHVSSDDFLVRSMYLVNQTTGETRTITQFHFLAWPENGVPENAKSLLQFRRKVHKSYRNLSAPILVHCSDGAGRSGTYTLIDIILDRIKNGAKEIDPRATLEHLRDQRIGLCASQSQFEFVLVALAEEIQIILNALPQ